MEKVYSAILAVANDFSEKGLSKNQTNTFQNFKFRGIDDLMNMLSPILTKNKLIILPHVVDVQRELTETTKGKASVATVVRVDYTLASAEDGSTTTVSFVGEAMDSGDKSVSKALAIAYKYFAFQTFCIPLEGGMEDPDATCYDRAPAPKKFDPAKLPDNPTGADEVPFEVSGGEDDVPFPTTKTALKKRTK